MKTITTLFILLCCITFANAQEKKEPTLYETITYIENKIKEGWSYRNKDNLPTNNKMRDVSFLGDSYLTESYVYNYEYYNEYLKIWQTAKYVDNEGYFDIDFKKLNDVVQFNETNTYLFVSIKFETKNVQNKTWITNGNYYVKQDEWIDQKTDSFWVPIPNEEGSFDRFKKALFHYKDLLIIEHKQKLAEDPFAN